MDLQRIYVDVCEILNVLNFNSIYSGFHKFKFALYNSEIICFDGKIIPYQEDFRGNTAKLYAGEYIAIWNMELDPVDDVEILAYSLVHEMFHCYQHKMGESRFPSDLTLLNRPDDNEYYQKKYNENLQLIEAYVNHDMEHLRKFAMIRNQRFAAFPEFLRQEYKTETIEGMAEYVALKALKLINLKKYHVIIESYLANLRTEKELLFDIRRMCYYSGSIYFLCLENLNHSVRNDFRLETTAYEQNVLDINNAFVDMVFSPCISIGYANYIRNRELKIAEYIRKSKYVKCNASICGYDPMNMFRVANKIYCSYFVSLAEDGVVINLTSAAVLELAEGSDQLVIGYYTMGD